MNSNSYQSDFDAIERNGERVWMHKAAPVWVVHYPGIAGSLVARYDCWRPYKAIEKVRHGVMPWSVNNKRIGPDDGFPSLDAALEAAAQVASSFATGRKE